MPKFPKPEVLTGQARTDFIAKYRNFIGQCYVSDVEFTKIIYPNWERVLNPESVFNEGRFSLDVPLCHIKSMFEMVKHGQECRYVEGKKCTNYVCWSYENTAGDWNPCYSKKAEF